MENTKIYVICANFYHSFSSSQKIISSFLSKLDAEYELWKLENQRQERFSCYGFNRYSIDEVNVITAEKGKDFKKFLEQKKNKIETSIQAEKECKESDIVDIAKLENELEELSRLQGK